MRDQIIYPPVCVTIVLVVTGLSKTCSAGGTDVH